jgi:hypothetical protein
MKIVLAQLKKDIRCQRTALILWVICLVLGLVPFLLTKGLEHTLGSDFDAHHLSDTQKVVGIMSYVAIFMACTTAAGFGMFLLMPILITRVVHDDPLMGTTSFWQTRPIPRPQLMLAKALFIGVLLIPLLAVSVQSGSGGNAQFWPGILALIAALAAIAAITPSTGAWFGYSAAFLFGKLVFSAIINALWNHYHGPTPLFSAETLHPLAETGKLLHLDGSDFFSLCYLVGFVGVFIHQYLTLRTRRSLLLFIAVLLAVALAQMFSGPAAGDSHSVIEFHSNVRTTP